MVVPSPPIVPCDDDGGVRPILAIADRISNRCYPRGPTAVAGCVVIGTGAGRNNPTHLRELAVSDVHQNLRLRDNHIIGPIRAGASKHAIDGLRLDMC